MVGVEPVPMAVVPLVAAKVVVGRTVVLVSVVDSTEVVVVRTAVEVEAAVVVVVRTAVLVDAGDEAAELVPSLKAAAQS